MLRIISRNINGFRLDQNYSSREAFLESFNYEDCLSWDNEVLFIALNEMVVYSSLLNPCRDERPICIEDVYKWLSHNGESQATDLEK